MASPENFPSMPGPGPVTGPAKAPPDLPAADDPLKPNVRQPDAEFRHTWQGRLLSVSFAIFAFEIGLCLVTFPWIDKTWNITYFQSVSPAVRDFWDDPYFRGAITGLGFINIYIALLEVGRLLRRPTAR